MESQREYENTEEAKLLAAKKLRDEERQQQAEAEAQRREEQRRKDEALAEQRKIMREEAAQWALSQKFVDSDEDEGKKQKRAAKKRTKKAKADASGSGSDDEEQEKPKKRKRPAKVRVSLEACGFERALMHNFDSPSPRKRQRKRAPKQKTSRWSSTRMARKPFEAATSARVGATRHLSRREALRFDVASHYADLSPRSEFISDESDDD